MFVFVRVRITATNNRCEIEQSKQKWIKRLNDRYTDAYTQTHIRPVLIRWFQHNTMSTHTHTYKQPYIALKSMTCQTVSSVYIRVTLFFQCLTFGRYTKKRTEKWPIVILSTVFYVILYESKLKLEKKCSLCKCVHKNP